MNAIMINATVGDLSCTSSSPTAALCAPPMFMYSPMCRPAVASFAMKDSASALGNCNAGLQGHAWALLSTLLTEVLPKTDWLKVWDHAFSNEPTFLLFLILSFMIAKRGQLAGCQSAEELDTVFRQTSTTDVNQVRLAPC